MSPVPDLYLEAFTFRVHLNLFIREWINLYFGLFSSTLLLFWLCCVLEGKGFVTVLPFLVMFHKKENIVIRKIDEMGYMLNVLLIEKYRSGLTETVYGLTYLTYALTSVFNIHPET